MRAVVHPFGQPALAAITFSPHGGGIAAVSRLIRDVLRDRATTPVPCITLAQDVRSFETSIASRIHFGLQLASLQASRRCDWVFYTHLNLAAVQRVLPRRVARPYAVFLHDIEAWTPLEPPVQRVLAGAFVRLANSRYTAARVASANPSGGSIVACPPGIANPASLAASPSAPCVPLGPDTVVIVGRMVSSERYKGHDQLIEAWPDVVAHVPGAALVCVGEGDDVARLSLKAREAGVGDAVRFTGFVDEATKAGILERAALLAMPSRREGFGLVYIEAMAAGLACIGSVHDAASDVIVEGDTGFLVDQDDRAGLVRRLVQLLTDEPLRRRLGAAGQARFRETFTYEAFRDRLTGHLVAALAERPAPFDRASGWGVA